jgi:cell division protein YceG involved in septum cleavage
VTRILGRILILLIVLGVGAAGAAAYVLWTRMHQPFQAFQGEQFVEIPAGAGSRAIARRKA